MSNILFNLCPQSVAAIRVAKKSPRLISAARPGRGMHGRGQQESLGEKTADERAFAGARADTRGGGNCAAKKCKSRGDFCHRGFALDGWRWQKTRPDPAFCLRASGPSPLTRATPIAGCFKAGRRCCSSQRRPATRHSYRAAKVRTTIGCCASYDKPRRNFFAATYSAASSSLA